MDAVQAITYWVNNMLQIIFAPGDVLNFYGNKYVVSKGNPNGEDTISVHYINGIELVMWVAPRPGVSKA